MSRLIIALTIFVSVTVNACSSVTVPSVSPTLTPTFHPTTTSSPTHTITNTPEPTHTSTATEWPKSTIREDTVIFNLPDSNSEILSHLDVGTSVIPLAKYKDFIKVEVLDTKIIGFVGDSSLDDTPLDLSELRIEEVPRQNIDVVNHFSIDLNVDMESASKVIVNNSENDGYNDELPLSLTLNTPFKITFQIETNDGQFGSIKLTDKPNNSEGDWWDGIHRIDFLSEGGRLKIEIRDGVTENSALRISLNVDDSQIITVGFADPSGKQFSIYDQDRKVIQKVDVTRLSEVALPYGLFPEKRVFVGRVASPQSQLIIDSLSIQVVPSGKWGGTLTRTDPSLVDLAEQLQISTGTLLNWWRLSDPMYWEILFSNFNTLIIHEFDGTFFWKGRGEYDFERVDRLVNWALKNGFKVRAFHLAWGATENEFGGVPQWLRNSNYTRDEYIQILEEYTKDVVGHYKGRVAEWSVANEAPSRSFYLGSDFWNKKIGPEYVDMVFQWAKEADPNAVLIFNDFNNESPRDADTRRIIDKMYSTVKTMKENDVPVDAVGMQMHLFLPWSSPIPPKKDEVIQTMQKFAELGVSVYITELDVSIHNCKGTQAECLEYQAQIYKDMADACIEANVCKSFTPFGFTDKESWITCTEDKWGCVGLPDASPLMFDSELQPKPAYYAVYEAFASTLNQNP